MNLIDPVTLRLVERALDVGVLRHVAIAQNIANANVAGARTVDVQFEQLLGEVAARIDAGQSVNVEDIPSPTVSWRPGTAAIALDEQMSALASNGMQYQALLRAVGRQLSLVSIAVNDGRR